MAHRLVRLILLPFLLLPPWADVAAAGAGEALPEHRAADPGAPPATAETLLASERFWPYQVALVRPWRPAGRAVTLSAGHAGVLIRVESSTRARIDFGRDGVYQVPIRETDLLLRANRVRRGELEKEAPNFVWAIGARLLDSASPVLAPLGLRSVAGYRAFLCVFADPRAIDFPDLARALAPLRERHGVATILFAQGERPDVELFERLRSLGWTVPFVHDHLSEAYTRSLLAGGPAPPALLLQTNEGRVLFERAWSAEVVPKLEAALDAAFASPPAGTASRPPPRASAATPR